MGMLGSQASIDPTSAIYSLIVLCTATLGISQYLHNGFKETVKLARETLSKVFREDMTAIVHQRNFIPVFQELANEYDRLDLQSLPQQTIQMVFLYLFLPFSGLLQGLNLLSLAYHLGWELTIGRFTVIAYGFLVALILWSGFAIKGAHTFKRRYSDEVASLVTRAADAHNMYCHLNAQPSVPQPSVPTSPIGGGPAPISPSPMPRAP